MRSGCCGRSLLGGLWIGLWALAGPSPSLAAGNGDTPLPAVPVAPILPGSHLGWTQAYRLQNEQVDAVLVPALGRLVHFSAREGENLLRLDPALQGKTPPENDPFFNIGGDWLWPVAQDRWTALSEKGRNWPPPPPLSHGPWNGSAWTDAEGASCALLSREYGAPLHIQVSRLFRLDPSSSALIIQQRIERTAPSPVPVVLWNISQVARAEKIAMPVDAASRFPGGLKTLMGRDLSRHLTSCGTVTLFHVPPAGDEAKMGSDSPRGWIAAARGPHLLFESASPSPEGAHPDDGCTVEFFANPSHGYAEIETLGPEVDLLPGNVLENTLRLEIAAMQANPDPCAFADAARTLAGE